MESKKPYLDEKIKIKEKLEGREHSSENWLELAENFFNNCLQVREVMNSDDYEAKRKIVEAVGWNLILNDKKLDIRFKKPYDVLLRPSIRSNVQRLVTYVRNFFSLIITTDAMKTRGHVITLKRNTIKKNVGLIR